MTPGFEENLLKEMGINDFSEIDWNGIVSVHDGHFWIKIDDPSIFTPSMLEHYKKTRIKTFYTPIQNDPQYLLKWYSVPDINGTDRHGFGISGTYIPQLKSDIQKNSSIE